jgi:hypothetical protein
MVLGQASEQVGQDNTEQQSGKTMWSLWMQLPLRMCRLSVPVLLVVLCQTLFKQQPQSQRRRNRNRKSTSQEVHRASLRAVQRPTQWQT